MFPLFLCPQTDYICKHQPLLTTEANSFMADIHNSKKRMPVILNKEDEQSWLNQTPYQEFMFPYQVQLIANRV